MKYKPIAIFFVFFFSILPPIFTQQMDYPVLRSASEISYPPFCSVNKDGEAQGFSVDLLSAALHAMKINVTFSVDTWNKVKLSLVKGDVDVLPMVGRTSEREEVFDFTFPYLEMHGVVVVRKNSIEPKSYTDLEGLKVGVMKLDNAEEFVNNNNTSVQLVRTENFKDALTLLSNGNIDAVIIQRLLAINLIEELNLDNLEISDLLLDDFVQSFCFAVKKGDSGLLSILNEGLAIIYSNGVYSRIQKKWFAEDGRLKRISGTIRVGGDRYFPPYEFLDERGNPTGYNVELTEAIARVMNMDIEIKLDTWSDTYQRLMSGKIDIVQGIYFSEDRARTISFTQPHTVINHTVFKRKNTGGLENLDDMRNSTCIVMENDIMQEFAVQNGFNSIILAPTLEEALRLLNDGQGDSVLGATLPSLYYIRKNHFNNIKDTGLSLLAPDYNYGALKDNDELLQRFSEGLKILKETGEYRQIKSKWLDVYDPQFSQKEVVRKLLFFIVPLIIVLILWFVWSLSIKLSVIRKTKRLSDLTSDLNHKVTELETAREHIHTTLLSIGDAVVSFDAAGIINQINPVAIKIMGLVNERLVGRDVATLFTIKELGLEDGEERVVNLLDSKTAFTIPRGILICLLNQIKIEISCTLSPILLTSGFFMGSVLVFRDISRGLRIQEQLSKKSRMEELGQLAGGVAHDFNNQLLGILGYGELILRHNTDSEIEKYAAVILKSAQKSSILVNKLLSFARQGKIQNETIDVHSQINELVHSIRILDSEGIEFVTNLNAESPQIKGDSHQVLSAISSIIQNAVDAIRFNNMSGQIIIETSNFSDSPKNIQLLKLSISDNGIGIAPEVQNKIFEPFFTTKSKVIGSGMGLSAAHGIINNHSGEISFESTHGKGTTFTVLFPTAI